MKNKSIPSPFATKEILDDMKTTNKLLTSVPEMAMLFIDTPLESTLKSKKFQDTARGTIMQQLQYRKVNRIETTKPVMILVIERGSFFGEMGGIKTGAVVYSPETNIMACFKGQAQIIG